MFWNATMFFALCTTVEELSRYDLDDMIHVVVVS